MDLISGTQPQAHEPAADLGTCPVMAFCVDQATRSDPVQLAGQPGLRHFSPFHSEDGDREPLPGMDAMLERVFGQAAVSHH
jgi:hypothetical protein